jgi:hypothetical protein
VKSGRDCDSNIADTLGLDVTLSRLKNIILDMEECVLVLAINVLGSGHLGMSTHRI